MTTHLQHGFQGFYLNPSDRNTLPVCPAKPDSQFNNGEFCSLPAAARAVDSQRCSFGMHSVADEGTQKASRIKLRHGIPDDCEVARQLNILVVVSNVLRRLIAPAQHGRSRAHDLPNGMHNSVFRCIRSVFRFIDPVICRVHCAPPTNTSFDLTRMSCSA